MVQPIPVPFCAQSCKVSKWSGRCLMNNRNSMGKRNAWRGKSTEGLHLRQQALLLSSTAYSSNNSKKPGWCGNVPKQEGWQPGGYRKKKAMCKL